MKHSDSASVTSNHSPNKKEWLHKWIQKISQTLQTDENKKMLQVFIIDPVLNHIFERLFPYIVIMCVLFVLLTIMIALILLLVFTRLPGALGVKSIS
jgi:CHASE3 domain sensor protein